MLTISPRVNDAFEKEAERAYMEKLDSFLREALPSLATVPPAEFLPKLRQIVAHARGYGLESEYAIASYTVTAGLLGLDFDSQFAGAAEILRSRASENEKADFLEGFTVCLFEALES